MSHKKYAAAVGIILMAVLAGGVFWGGGRKRRFWSWVCLREAIGMWIVPTAL